MTADTVPPERKLGLLKGISMIVGIMIGSGIFISPKGVLEASKSVGLTMIVWLGCGVITMLSSLSYVELGTFITKSGGEFAYILHGLPAVLAFLCSWCTALIIRPSAIAVSSLVFAEYVASPIFDSCGPPVVFVKCLAAAAIILITAINCYSTDFAASIQVAFTVAKITALIIIIIGGFVMMGKGEFYDLPEGFTGSETSGSVIALAFYDGLWAFEGWNNLNYAIEELKNPYRNLPLAILIGIPLVTVLYLLTNVSYLAVMTKRELLRSATVGGLWADRVLGVAAIIIPISVAMSTFGATNGICFTSGRLTYAAAREGHLPQVLSYLHIRKKTPVISLIFSAIIALIMIIPGEISSLIDFFSFTAWLFYGLAFLSLIVMRFTKKDEPRPFKVFILVPVVMLIISVYLVVAPIVQNPDLGFLYAFLLIIGGLIFYFIFLHFKVQLPCMEAFTEFIQKFACVAPSKYKPPDHSKDNKL
ncbi:b(0,+)-type amino acid transporter 1-like isoform X1 [Octopus sinensis]|uniref:b(0,+)-type amino acid transporter 1 n=1 Tax=Octopus sinensis TaxID=2607531 RepID=A0A6P7T8R3_9MOLL|nr:b(0,+)-type amino acid transporter 1-like isoform X1 [Octopus sinensis]